MSDDMADRGKKLLIIVLIAANLLMLVIGIITIPPNLRGKAKKANISDAAKFYKLNNKQYAIGTMATPNGTPAFIAPVRP
ncbi:MAG: hypothetical protein ACOCG5_00885 [Candidatus Alkaliphilus sp. MAG34]